MTGADGDSGQYAQGLGGRRTGSQDSCLLGLWESSKEILRNGAENIKIRVWKTLSVTLSQRLLNSGYLLDIGLFSLQNFKQVAI